MAGVSRSGRANTGEYGPSPGPCGDQVGKRVRICEIADNNNQNQSKDVGPCDYLQVRLKWHSILGESRGPLKECHFIFCEEDDEECRQISAFLYAATPKAKDVYRKLCSERSINCVWRLRGFWVEFRGDMKPRLILSDRSSDVTELLAEDENDNSYNFVGRSGPDRICNNNRQALGALKGNGIENSTTDKHKNHQKFQPKVYDLVNESEPLEVIVELAKKYMDANPADTYKMRSRPTRGLVCIINNIHYPHMKEPIREGSNQDVMNLTKLLKAFSFKVVIKTDVKSSEISSVISQFKSEATKDMQCCIVVYLGHGVEGYILTPDDVGIPLYTSIINPFDEEQFPIFKDKPKLFLLQKCRNNPPHWIKNKLKSSLANMNPSKSLKNTIVCFATSAGDFAYRDQLMGSYFIYALVDTLMEHAHDSHFVEMLKEVQSRLLRVRNRNGQQILCTWDTFGFNKKLYFNPGL